MGIKKWNNNEAFEKWNDNEAFEKWNDNETFEKWNDNEAFEKWNDNSNIAGIKLDFNWHHLEYWKNNWLIKKFKVKYKENVCESQQNKYPMRPC